ncbi:MAG: hypothetical protein QF805_27800, partial [Pirellulaceae bacterium]|nr:hypothetical protein [Pirellulaceae bacterium]
GVAIIAATYIRRAIPSQEVASNLKIQAFSADSVTVAYGRPQRKLKKNIRSRLKVDPRRISEAL